MACELRHASLHRRSQVRLSTAQFNKLPTNGTSLLSAPDVLVSHRPVWPCSENTKEVGVGLVTKPILSCSVDVTIRVIR